ncbi:hypothetical protein [Sphingomonas sp. PP-CC-1A-547]|uniref:hypothetical protein n=1 Tax=Sphingomonas sp. PP-CC-1A-547 TaxID=2135654 RepID=UPI000FF78441|nr:hypothetical protein [Sphingomonas sp. PP-CC-1A-547]RKE50297.1 hypothetical protein C8J39_1866 [Sphingomonas sp. PP-CC-1A-547]
MIDLVAPSAEELSVSRREHPYVPQAVLELAMSMACDRGGSTIPVGSYDIQRARDQMAADVSENAQLRADLAAAKAELASLRAANLVRDRAA